MELEVKFYNKSITQINQLMIRNLEIKYISITLSIIATVK